ncbi:MAG TPA: histidine phosphatase family protein [Longimicrobiaceae bacterium]|nr:histidine phosphatase family protein [Longimicrobiaceae bacterium]
MRTVILLRHADIDPGPAPYHLPLNAAGQERAQALAHTLGEAGITRIFVSQALRPQQTVAPLVERLGLQTQSTPSPPQAAQQILAGQEDGVVLVAGHSDTVPAIIGALGAAAPVPILHGHDDLFVVVVAAPDRAEVIRLKYGRPSPA